MSFSFLLFFILYLKRFFLNIVVLIDQVLNRLFYYYLRDHFDTLNLYGFDASTRGFYNFYSTFEILCHHFILQLETGGYIINQNWILQIPNLHC